MIQRLRSPFLDGCMTTVTHLADNGFIWIVIAIVLLLFKRCRPGGLMLALTLVIEFVCNDLILKNIFKRPRPCDLAPLTDMLVNRPGGWSMPSGHTAVSFAAATAIYAINKKWGVFAYIAAALIGFSRLYVYVHFPTDVIGGMLVGLACGWAGVKAAKMMDK